MGENEIRAAVLPLIPPISIFYRSDYLTISAIFSTSATRQSVAELYFLQLISYKGQWLIGPFP